MLFTGGSKDRNLAKHIKFMKIPIIDSMFAIIRSDLSVGRSLFEMLAKILKLSVIIFMLHVSILLQIKT